MGEAERRDIAAGRGSLREASGEARDGRSGAPRHRARDGGRCGRRRVRRAMGEAERDIARGTGVAAGGVG
jgi:hypothetical protein